MSILIKGMEMPKRCGECYVGFCKQIGCELSIGFDGYNTNRHHSCPLIKLQPHGRLIDADALRLLYDFHSYKPTWDLTEEEFDQLMCRFFVIRANIDDAPTIIEAEGE